MITYMYLFYALNYETLLSGVFRRCWA